MPCPAQWKRRRRQAVRLNGSCSCYPSVEPRFSAGGEERSPSPKPGAVERAPTPARAPRRVTGADGEPTGRLCTGSRVADRPDGKAPLLGSHAHAGVPIPLRLQPLAPVALLRVLFLQPSTRVRPAMPPPISCSHGTTGRHVTPFSVRLRPRASLCPQTPLLPGSSCHWASATLTVFLVMHMKHSGQKATGGGGR